MSDQERREKLLGWKKVYVVYSKKFNMIGIHKGPKFIAFDDEVAFWPHDIDHGGLAMLLCDEDFRKDYVYVGEL